MEPSKLLGATIHRPVDNDVKSRVLRDVSHLENIQKPSNMEMNHFASRVKQSTSRSATSSPQAPEMTLPVSLIPSAEDELLAVPVRRVSHVEETKDFSGVILENKSKADKLGESQQSEVGEWNNHISNAADTSGTVHIETSLRSTVSDDDSPSGELTIVQNSPVYSENKVIEENVAVEALTVSDNNKIILEVEHIVPSVGFGEEVLSTTVPEAEISATSCDQILASRSELSVVSEESCVAKVIDDVTLTQVVNVEYTSLMDLEQREKLKEKFEESEKLICSETSEFIPESHDLTNFCNEISGSDEKEISFHLDSTFIEGTEDEETGTKQTSQNHDMSHLNFLLNNLHIKNDTSLTETSFCNTSDIAYDDSLIEYKRRTSGVKNLMYSSLKLDDNSALLHDNSFTSVSSEVQQSFSEITKIKELANKIEATMKNAERNILRKKVFEEKNFSTKNSSSVPDKNDLNVKEEIQVCPLPSSASASMTESQLCSTTVLDTIVDMIIPDTSGIKQEISWNSSSSTDERMEDVCKTPFPKESISETISGSINASYVENLPMTSQNPTFLGYIEKETVEEKHLEMISHPSEIKESLNENKEVDILESKISTSTFTKIVGTEGKEPSFVESKEDQKLTEKIGSISVVNTSTPISICKTSHSSLEKIEGNVTEIVQSTDLKLQIDASQDSTSSMYTTLDVIKPVDPTVSSAMKVPLDTTLDLKAAHNTSEDLKAPLNTTLDFKALVNTTLDVKTPLDTSLDLNDLMNTTLDLKAPLDTTLDFEAPHNTTQDLKAPLDSTVELKAPLDTTLNLEATLDSTLNLEPRLDTMHDLCSPLNTTLELKVPMDSMLALKAPLDTAEILENHVNFYEEVTSNLKGLSVVERPDIPKINNETKCSVDVVVGISSLISSEVEFSQNLENKLDSTSASMQNGINSTGQSTAGVGCERVEDAEEEKMRRLTDVLKISQLSQNLLESTYVAVRRDGVASPMQTRIVEKKDENVKENCMMPVEAAVELDRKTSFSEGSQNLVRTSLVSHVTADVCKGILSTDCATPKKSSLAGESKNTVHIIDAACDNNISPSKVNSALTEMLALDVSEKSNSLSNSFSLKSPHLSMQTVPFLDNILSPGANKSSLKNLSSTPDDTVVGMPASTLDSTLVMNLRGTKQSSPKKILNSEMLGSERGGNVVQVGCIEKLEIDAFDLSVRHLKNQLSRVGSCQKEWNISDISNPISTQLTSKDSQETVNEESFLTIESFTGASDTTPGINGAREGIKDFTGKCNPDEVFKDPSSFDFLIQCGNSRPVRDLRKESLYIKFDPLIGSPRSCLPSLLTSAITSSVNENGDKPVTPLVIENQSDRVLIDAATSFNSSILPMSPVVKEDHTSVEEVNNLKEQVELLQKLLDETTRVHKEEVNRLEKQIGAHEFDLLKAKDIINELKTEVVQSRKEKEKMSSIKDNYESVMAQFEKAMADLVSERKLEQLNFEAVQKQLLSEQETLRGHLNNTERAFTDLHTKYESCKNIIKNQKDNEDILCAKLVEYESALQKAQKQYETLKLHATSQLESANQELHSIQTKHQAEISQLKAIIKRNEIKLTSLEEQVEQKTKENNELILICDELISKVGSKS